MFRCILFVLAVTYTHGTTVQDLSTIATLAQTVTISSPNPSTVFPTLTGSYGPATYDGTTPVAFQLIFNFTYTGNITPQIGFVLLTNADDKVQVAVQFTCGPQRCTSTTLVSQIFVNTGVYSATLVVFSNNNIAKSFSPSDLAALPAGANWNGVNVNPAFPELYHFNSFLLPSPQSLVCTSARSCDVYFNATVAPNADVTVTTHFRSSIPANGVMWSIAEDCALGVCNPYSNNRQISWSVGSIVNGRYESGGIQSPSSGMPAQLTIGAVLTSVAYAEISDDDTTAYVSLSSQASVVANGGVTDQDAPTCTVAQLTPDTVVTANANVPVTVTLTCSDGNGYGVVKKGAFVSLIRPGAETTVTIALMDGSVASTTIDAPPYSVGTFQLSGVFAIDYAGNAVLYGSCAGVGIYDTLCNSALSVAVNTFGLLILLTVMIALS